MKKQKILEDKCIGAAYDNEIDINKNDKAYKDLLEALTNPNFKYLHIECEKDCYDDYELNITVYVEREETDEELQKRIEAHERKSIAAKKAAETRKKKKEKEERALLAELKKKYPDE